MIEVSRMKGAPGTWCSRLTGLVLAVLWMSPPAAAQEHTEPATPSASKPAAQNAYPTEVYWGDAHLHTVLSIDSYTAGNGLTLEQSYAIAKGETVKANSGQDVRLSRPLDFLVVTDHAEYLGFGVTYEKESVQVPADGAVGRLKNFIRDGKRAEAQGIFLTTLSGATTLETDDTQVRDGWDAIIEAADRHNDPGQFTAFIGYEWSATPENRHTHRNIVFADDGSKASQVDPFSAFDSSDPEDLWAYLQDYEHKTGGKVIAIPHNTNLSGGSAFLDETFGGDSFTSDYAQRRARWEPLVEASQTKGDSETHKFLSPNDEFADYETWSLHTISPGLPEKEESSYQYEYVRSALRLGLAHEAELGTNPFQFGLIGSTDSHIGLSTVEENNLIGPIPHLEPSPTRAHIKVPTSPLVFSSFTASGYAAVWATENTRAAIFDAMKRRETYATTGPRMTVRFFGGFDYSEADLQRPDFVTSAYEKGVPMGSELAAAASGKTVGFLVTAAKDPMGANLDRVQVIKGWLDDDGTTHEKVFDVALSDGRDAGASGKAPALKSSVDIGSATYTNDIGAATLSVFWQDPEFDAAQSAFYYVRVLEIPTPRWSTYDAAQYGTELPTNVPSEIQERAYTSAIWYRP